MIRSQHLLLRKHVTQVALFCSSLVQDLWWNLAMVFVFRNPEKCQLRVDWLVLKIGSFPVVPLVAASWATNEWTHKAWCCRLVYQVPNPVAIMVGFKSKIPDARSGVELHLSMVSYSYQGSTNLLSTWPLQFFHLKSSENPCFLHQKGGRICLRGPCSFIWQRR